MKRTLDSYADGEEIDIDSVILPEVPYHYSAGSLYNSDIYPHDIEYSGEVPEYSDDDSM